MVNGTLSLQKGEGRISLDAFLAAMTKDSSVTQAISFYGALL